MSHITITGKDASKPIMDQSTTTLEGSVNPGPLLDALVDPKRVILDSAGSTPTPDQQALWSGIRTRTRWMAYPVFEEVVKNLGHCPNDTPAPLPAVETIFVRKAQTLMNPSQSNYNLTCYHGPDAYLLLKATAEAFLATMCQPTGVFDPDELSAISNAVEAEEAARSSATKWEKLSQFLSPSSYPYIEKVKSALVQTVKYPLCDGSRDCFYPVELIWSYWHEEGMLIQSLNAICLRFQNKRGPSPRDPLANLRLNPLRPLSTLLWGYIQDEQNRLTVARRAYEYDHEYGLRLVGRAVPDMQTVDSRSKFLEAFHNLLHVAVRFYRQADDTTFHADAFPLLNALRGLHLVLAQGAHNQFGDLPWAARVEMLIQKWLLSRPEIREFLGGAPMVPYKESWMAHADSMKTLQGWSDVSVSHYRDLGVFGEQILLSVRYQDWNKDDITQANAYNWAIYWRPEIQSYIHSYRAVTGVDLSAELTDTRSAAARNIQPAIHQLRRARQQVRNPNSNGVGRNGFDRRPLMDV